MEPVFYNNNYAQSVDESPRDNNNQYGYVMSRQNGYSIQSFQASQQVGSRVRGPLNVSRPILRSSLTPPLVGVSSPLDEGSDCIVSELSYNNLMSPTVSATPPPVPIGPSPREVVNNNNVSNVSNVNVNNNNNVSNNLSNNLSNNNNNDRYPLFVPNV